MTKRLLSLLLTSTLLLSMLTSCASEKNTKASPKSYENVRPVRTVSGGSNVTCHNCRAKFKLSARIQKLVREGNAEVEFPVCHKNYISGKVIKH